MTGNDLYNDKVQGAEVLYETALVKQDRSIAILQPSCVKVRTSHCQEYAAGYWQADVVFIEAIPDRDRFRTEAGMALIRM